MLGTLYGVGVGPGDPELMTLKAVRLIRESGVIACPGAVPQETTAYQIAIQAVPELAEKELVPIRLPMTHDQEALARSREEGARRLEAYLNQGKNTVFLTLGDPAIYSTFSYIQEIVQSHGYPTALVSGVPSFCAAAARVNLSLVEWNEPLHVVPAAHRLDLALSEPGNYVLMKSGRSLGSVKEILSQSGLSVVMVENCGMENEHIYRTLEKIPDSAGYYSLIIAKKPKGSAASGTDV